MRYTTKNIGTRIKKCRKERNMTQEQLAEKLDISQNYLGQIENGKRGVNISNLTKIANELDITFDYLMSENNSEAIKSDTNDKKVWLSLIDKRSPKERKMLIRIVSDLIYNIFDYENDK